MYDTKHGKTLDEIVEKVRARLDFIGVDWVEEDEGDGDYGTTKPVRLLDYACGTGNISRVRNFYPIPLSPFMAHRTRRDLP